MTNRDILIAFVSSLVGAVIGGVIVLLFEQTLSIFRERTKVKHSRIVKDPNADKVISESIYYDLAPGKTIELMKQMLGAPTKYSQLDFPVFSEDEVRTHSYLYVFKNAYVKVTSKDNATIDSVTILPFEESFPMSSLLLPDDVRATKFRDFKVTPDMVEWEWNNNFLSTLRDSAFVIEYLTGAPTHLHYVFFGYGGSREEYERTNSPKVFIGEQINGVCISSSEEAYYIYDTALR